MGGYLNQRLGWRTAFCVVGLPGLIFSLLFYATVKELRRGATDANNPANSTYALDQVLTMLYSIKYLFGCHLLLPSTCFAFARGGLTHRFGKANKRWYLKIPGYAIMIVISCITGAYFLKLNFDGYLFGFVRPAAKHVPGACVHAVAYLGCIFYGDKPYWPWFWAAGGWLHQQPSKAIVGGGVPALALSILIVVSGASTDMFFVTAKKLREDLKLQYNMIPRLSRRATIDR